MPRRDPIHGMLPLATGRPCRCRPGRPGRVAQHKAEIKELQDGQAKEIARLEAGNKEAIERLEKQQKESIESLREQLKGRGEPQEADDLRTEMRDPAGPGAGPWGVRHQAKTL